MEITEVRIKLMESSEDRLRAFCSITFDHCFVVRDLKIIDGSSGPFVAMPSRKLTCHCPRCGHKNHLRANFCNQCGGKMRAGREGEPSSPQKLYADIAHPINSECREMIQDHVIREFDAELGRSSEPGYRSRYDDEFDAAAAEAEEAAAEARKGPEEVAKQPPPKPHFESKQEERQSAGKPDDPREDKGGFGAGIFDQ